MSGAGPREPCHPLHSRSAAEAHADPCQTEIVFDRRIETHHRRDGRLQLFARRELQFGRACGRLEECPAGAGEPQEHHPSGLAAFGGAERSGEPHVHRDAARGGDQPTPPRRYSKPPDSARRPSPARRVTTTIPPQPTIRYSRSPAAATLSRASDDDPLMSKLISGSHSSAIVGGGTQEMAVKSTASIAARVTTT